MCLENVIYITKQEKVSIYYLGPFLGEFVRAKRKSNFGNVIGQRKNSPRKKVGSVPTILVVASREQIRPVENVILVIILLPVKYLLKLSGSRNFYRLRMTSLTSTNVFTISCLSIASPPPPPPVNLVLQHWCKALQSLYCTIRQLFVLFVVYSRTLRTIRRLFADYSYYSSTIRTIRTIAVPKRKAWHSFMFRALL